MNHIKCQLGNCTEVRYFWSPGMQSAHDDEQRRLREEQNKPRITKLRENYEYAKLLYEQELLEQESDEYAKSPDCVELNQT